jgi:hypothetical protein
MVAQPTDKTLDGIQRFLADLRSYSDRRSWGERRAFNQPVSVERRAGPDRRTRPDRRSRDRGCYNADDAAEIMMMAFDPAARAACPECGAPLMLGPVRGCANGAVRRVQCTGCRRALEIGIDDQ